MTNDITFAASWFIAGSISTILLAGVALLAALPPTNNINQAQLEPIKHKELSR
jgi:hypothetical protein